LKPHKWAKEIKAWADGAEIEQKIGETWHQVLTPGWTRDTEYRIKPQPKEPQYYQVYNVNGNIKFIRAGMFIEHDLNKDYLEYLGKIKLEVDDETETN
jgi:hypothetical protein